MEFGAECLKFALIPQIGLANVKKTDRRDSKMHINIPPPMFFAKKCPPLIKKVAVLSVPSVQDYTDRNCRKGWTVPRVRPEGYRACEAGRKEEWSNAGGAIPE